MRSSAIAWRPISKARWTSQKNSATTTQHADQAELLADHRQQEVGVRFRQVVQLLDAAAEADAEPFAAAERDQRVRQLVGLARRVVLLPRIEVREDARAAPRLQHTSSAKADRHRAEAAEQLTLTPPRNRMPIAMQRSP